MSFENNESEATETNESLEQPTEQQGESPASTPGELEQSFEQVEQPVGLLDKRPTESAEQPAEQPADEPAPAFVVPEPIQVTVPDPEELAALKNLEERRRRARRNRIIKIVVACAIVVAAVAGWLIYNAMQNASKTEAAAPEVAAAIRMDLSSTIQATGSLKPGSQVAVTPEVSGIVQQVMVVEGQRVERGDVLLTLKNDDLEKAVNDASTALDRAKRNLDNANAGVSTAWDDYYAAIDAYNAQVDAANAGTGADPGTFDHSGYLSAIDAANASVTSAQDAVNDAQRTYDAAVEQADKRTVRAPAAGSVLDLKAVEGASTGGATGGTSTAASETLMKIADLSTLNVDVEVNEIDITNVKPGQTAQITFTAVPGLSLEGKVVSVASVASSSGGDGAATGGGVVTFKVVVTIEKPDESLKPGMSASVQIVTKDVKGALVIPSAAVVEEGADAYVQVVADEKAANPEMRQIVVGERSGSQVSVTSGLAEGELVLIASPTGSSASATSANAV